MKITPFFVAILFLLLLSCSKSDVKQNQNPYLTNPVVNLNLNLNLPEYNPLKFPGSLIVIPGGIKGIVVYCVSETQYLAFDLTDPNHPPSQCSRMELDGVMAECQCPTDDNAYLITNFGQPSPPDGTKYPMQQYRAERRGNNVIITN